MLVDNRLTCPARNGNVLVVGIKRYAYADTTQMARVHTGVKTAKLAKKSFDWNLKIKKNE